MLMLETYRPSSPVWKTSAAPPHVYRPSTPQFSAPASRTFCPSTPPARTEPLVPLLAPARTEQVGPRRGRYARATLAAPRPAAALYGARNTTYRPSTPRRAPEPLVLVAEPGADASVLEQALWDVQQLGGGAAVRQSRARRYAWPSGAELRVELLVSAIAALNRDQYRVLEKQFYRRPAAYRLDVDMLVRALALEFEPPQHETRRSVAELLLECVAGAQLVNATDEQVPLDEPRPFLLLPLLGFQKLLNKARRELAHQ